MLASYHKKFIYVKTMKTAGTSTEAWLERYCLPDNHQDYWSDVEYRELGEHSRYMTVTDSGIVGGRYHGVRLNDRYYNHMPLNEIRDRMQQDRPGMFAQCMLIANARNPWDRMVSLFWNQNKHQLDLLRTAPFKQVQHLFYKFIRSRSTAQMMWSEEPRYCLDGKFAIDVVIRYEHLREDLEALSDRLDLELAWDQFPRHKTEWRVRPEPFQSYYTDQKCIDAVIVGSAFEIRQFGYQFQDA